MGDTLGLAAHPMADPPPPPPPPLPPPTVRPPDTEKSILRRIEALGRQLTRLRLKKQEFHLYMYDLETTGIGKTEDIRICEIAVMGPWPSRKVRSWYVNPTIPNDGVKINKLKQKFLEQFPTWAKVGIEVGAWLQSRPGPIILCGYNSKRYDSRILTFECERHGHYASGKFPLDGVMHADLREVFRAHVKGMPAKGKRSLQAYYAHVNGGGGGGGGHNDAHTAAGDCDACAAVLDACDTTAIQTLLDQKESSYSVIKRCFR